MGSHDAAPRQESQLHQTMGHVLGELDPVERPFLALAQVGDGGNRGILPPSLPPSNPETKSHVHVVSIKIALDCVKGDR